MCLEYLDALCPVGIARLIILQGKVFILGNKFLYFQFLFSRESVGIGEPAPKRACGQFL
jgi:hypothetical protein